MVKLLMEQKKTKSIPLYVNTRSEEKEIYIENSPYCVKQIKPPPNGSRVDKECRLRTSDYDCVQAL